MRFFLLLSLISITQLLTGQEVTTLTNITANGGVTVGPDGTLYVAHFGPLPPNPSIGKNLYRVSPDGDFSIFLENKLKVGSGNSYHSQGFVFQSSLTNNTIYKIDLDGNVVDSIIGVTRPVGIVEGPDESLYICACQGNTIQRYTVGGDLSQVASGSSFACANGITFAGDGNLYTTNFNDGRITRVSLDGITETIGNTPAGNGHLAYRQNDSLLYIASYQGNRIYRMTLDGEVELFAGTGSAGSLDNTDPLQATFFKPNGIEFSPDGCSLYITQDQNVLREIKFTDGGCGVNATKEWDAGQDVTVSPNPTNGKLNIETKGDIFFKKMTIMDIGGRVVLPENDFQQNIDVSDFGAGVYYLLLKGNEGVSVSKKFIIK